jgi:hypothetical protein
MRKFVTATAIVLAAAWTVGRAIPAAQENRSLPVKIDNLPAGAKLRLALNTGKTPKQTVPGTANQAGDAMLALDLGNLGKNDQTQVDVYVSKPCPDGAISVVIVEHGAKPPDDCDHTLVGVFWLNRAEGLTVHVGGGIGANYGLFTPRNIAIGAGGLGAIIIGLAAGGDDAGSGTGTPGTGGGGATTFSGTYTGTGTATTNTCSFSSSAPIRGVLSVNSSGVGTWQKTHTAAGVTFNFNVTLNVSGSQATFQATTTQSISGATYTVTDTAAQITSTGMTLTQRFARSGVCDVVYLMTLTKS